MVGGQHQAKKNRLYYFAHNSSVAPYFLIISESLIEVFGSGCWTDRRGKGRKGSWEGGWASAREG